MSVVVIGLNHRSVPLDILEQMTVSADELPKALGDVASREHVSGAVVLSTCNRTEVYVNAEKFHGAFQDVRSFLGETAFLPPEDFSDYLYVTYDGDAVSHLFSVTCGLDSAVVGESEIQGQVKTAWQAAQAEGTCGTTLNTVFRHALEVGKRARTETGISRNTTSVSTAAVAMAAERLDSLDGRKILVLGAGAMAEGMASSLSSIDAELMVANRTLARAEEVARRIGGSAIALEDLATTLVDVDLMLTSTGASSLMLEHGELAAITANRSGRPLLIVDIAVPRDVDPSAGNIAGVTLLDMDDLRAFAEAGMRERRGEIDKVRRIIDIELERYADLSSAREAGPLILAFRANAEQIRVGELDRLGGQLGSLTDEQRESVDALTKSILNKVLHDPTVRLKDAAGSARGDRLADALRDLFDL